MADIPAMSQQARDGAAVVKEAAKGHLTARETAELLSLSRRHVLRLLKRFHLEGDADLIHRLRGRSSNRGYSKKVKARVSELYWQPEYRDYSPTLFTEILASDHKIRVNHETVRRLLMAAGASNVQRKKRPHRSKRPRCQAVGDMILLGGSDCRYTRPS